MCGVEGITPAKAQVEFQQFLEMIKGIWRHKRLAQTFDETLHEGSSNSICMIWQMELEVETFLRRKRQRCPLKGLDEHSPRATNSTILMKLQHA